MLDDPWVAFASALKSSAPRRALAGVGVTTRRGGAVAAESAARNVVWFLGLGLVGSIVAASV